MKRMMTAATLAVAPLALTLSLAAPAEAQSTRTTSFVSINGNDSNQCFAATPCRTLQRAIDLLAANGTVIVLTAGEYDEIKITRGINIMAEGVGAVIVSQAVGIQINVENNQRVLISGLSVVSRGGLCGILIEEGRDVHLKNLTVANFNRSDRTDVFGIDIDGSATNDVEINLENVTLANNKGGLRVIAPIGSSKFVRANIYRSVIDANIPSGSAGSNIVVDGSRASVRLSDSMLSGAKAWTLENGGEIFSFGNNTIVGNATPDATPLPLK